MRKLVAELIPHAPQLGLFVAPDIPADRLRNALSDFAANVPADDVLALYDATLLGSGKDGAVFTPDRVVFQNNTLEPVHDVYYRDLVHVEAKRKLLGGRKLHLDVNRGRATFNLVMDFSGKPDAAEYVARFLHEVMIRGAAAEMDVRSAPGTPSSTGTPPSGATDVPAVQRALDELHRRGLLSDADHRRLKAVLDGRS